MSEKEIYEAKKCGKIMLNANETSINISNEIKYELIDRIKEIPFNRYPDETSGELIKAYAKVADTDPRSIIAGNGSDEMLGFMIGYFLGKDKNLCTLSPDFSMYDYYASVQGANVVKYSTKEDGSFDVDGFISGGLENHADMVIFSNPNNPTGNCLNKEDLRKIVKAFAPVPVIVDEAYKEFSDVTMIDEIEDFDNLYVTRTLSKAYGLAGARIGFLAGNLKNIEVLRKHIVPYNISRLDQVAGTVVLGHADEYKENIKVICEERDRMYNLLSKLKALKVYPSKANYIYGRCQNKEKMLKYLDEEGIVIRTYNDDGFRITIGTKEENELVLKCLQAFDREDLK